MPVPTVTTRDFSPARRQECLDRLGEGPLDLVVVGGGITGAGVARDAALRGLRVALLEQADFAFGTSSRSSKLIHGGFRYLQNLQFHMVYESVRERTLLMDLAPHRVRPLRFLFPTYRDHGFRAWQVHAGLTLYDAMTLFRNLDRHQMLDAEALRKLEPLLRDEGLEGGSVYSDAVTDDALLTVDTARGACEAGALTLPYVEAVEFRTAGGRVRGVTARDRLTGRDYEIEAAVVVNATGPWTDLTRNRTAGEPPGRPLLHVTRGSHIAIPRSLLPADHAVVLTRASEGRILFTIPWGDVVIAGTTDTYYDGDPADVRATRSDVEYILETLQRYFPQVSFGDDSVLGTYAGLRPLIRQEGVAESAVSREDRVVEDPPGLITVAGGKLTTYRRMGRKVTDLVVRALGRRPDLGKPGSCVTGLIPLRTCPGFGAADPEAAMHARASGLEPPVIKALRARQPCDWTEVLRLIADDRALAQPLPPLEGPGSGHMQAEVVHAVRQMMTLTLSDLVCRRLWLHVRCADAAREALPVAARLMAAELGWDEAEVARQVEAATRELAVSQAWKTGS